MLFEYTNGLVLPKSGRDIGSKAWQRLAEQLRSEAVLLPFSPEVLEARFNRGETAIITHKDQIISHLSCMEVLRNGRISFDGDLVLIAPQLSSTPSIRLLSTGWTDSGFRKKGLSFLLRKKLLERFSTSNAFVIGVSTHNGALGLLQKLGCQPVLHGDIPFVQTLSCIGARMGMVLVGGVKEQHSLWTSNPELASRANGDILKRMRLSLAGWRALLEIKTFWGFGAKG